MYVFVCVRGREKKEGNAILKVNIKIKSHIFLTLKYNVTAEKRNYFY